jgi:hypothetical protein
LVSERNENEESSKMFIQNVGQSEVKKVYKKKKNPGRPNGKCSK